MNTLVSVYGQSKNAQPILFKKYIDMNSFFTIEARDELFFPNVQITTTHAYHRHCSQPFGPHGLLILKKKINTFIK